MNTLKVGRRYKLNVSNIEYYEANIYHGKNEDFTTQNLFKFHENIEFIVLKIELFKTRKPATDIKFGTTYCYIPKMNISFYEYNGWLAKNSIELKHNYSKMWRDINNG